MLKTDRSFFFLEKIYKYKKDFFIGFRKNNELTKIWLGNLLTFGCNTLMLQVFRYSDLCFVQKVYKL